MPRSLILSRFIPTSAWDPGTRWSALIHKDVDVQIIG
jgi:hypothetical protein